MIELLIVIAILGILAVAVLSAINPIEQINRGRDTGSRSDAEQLLTAIDRYYAMQGYFPWQTNPSDLVDFNDAGAWYAVDDALVGLDDCPILYLLSDTASGPTECDDAVGSQELKVTFVDKVSAATYNPLYIFHNDDNFASTYVCYRPQSNSFAVEAFNRLDTNADGAIDGTDSIPDDYPADAWNNTTQCGTDGNCVCLP